MTLTTNKQSTTRTLTVCVVSPTDFPECGATAVRMLAYTRGLVQAGVSVHVIMPFPGLVYSSPGEIHGVSFINTYGSAKSKIKLFRGIARVSQFRYLSAIVRAYVYMSRNYKDKCDFILVGDTIKITTSFLLIAKRIGAKCVFVADEFPIPIRHKLKTSIPVWKVLGYKCVLKRIDGFIFISRQLEQYYNAIRAKPTFVMPVIVDVSRFYERSQAESNEDKRNYLCYMGNMELSKDNVDLIIKAFAKIADLYPDVDLHLYGQPRGEGISILKKLVDELGLSGRVSFKGRVDSSCVPSILFGAHVLVSSQPLTMRASGGFPTKLGEYLMTGKPTLVTRVGENDVYVTEGQHAYFSEPDSVDDYANKLNYIMDNYSEAIHVAKEAREFVEAHYSQSSVGEKLKAFLTTICL